MSMTGRVFSVKIKDNQNSKGISAFSNVTLELTKNGINSKVAIKIPPDNEVVSEFRLKDCTYMNESSTPGIVDSIQNNSTQQILIILDKQKQCTQLLDYIRSQLTNDERESSDPADVDPVQNEKVNQLIRALNNNDTNSATKVARQLAGEQISIRFALDMIDESGNAVVRQPPEPVVEPLKLKLSIESFLVSQNTNEEYDVAILPHTTIKNLKQIVERDTKIPSHHQYWYIDREQLDDSYIFGVSPPRVNERTILVLFIVKPRNN